MSYDADSYFYSFQKLKQVLKLNNQIDTVLLSFSFHNIEKSIEERWLLNNKHLNSRLKIYLPLMDLNDFFFLLKNKPSSTITGLFNQTLLPYYLFVKGGHIYGGYQDLNHNILKNEIEKLHKKETKNNFVQADIENEYLKKIIDYCKKDNIIIILINTPLHREIQDSEDELYKFYKNNYSNIPFYDFSKIKMEDSYFGDLNHLSPIGASYFSKLIKQENLFNENIARVHNILYK